MLLKVRSCFKLEAGESEEVKSSSLSSVVVGLKILTQISHGKPDPVVVKPALKISFPTCRKHHGSSGRSPVDHSCFLKSCHLCHKKLSLDKEVYMYRGDQGFCSVECRDRQIVLDEMRELELSTKQMLASSRHCSASDRRDTRIVLDDLRRRNNSHHNQKHWTIAS
ncbi:hypothetical protein DITRI_Ditri02bG0069600 [Diplodiscus trichospermus]